MIDVAAARKRAQEFVCAVDGCCGVDAVEEGRSGFCEDYGCTEVLALCRDVLALAEALEPQP